MTEAGKEWATVEVPYTPGFTATPIIEARTIHADGTVSGTVKILMNGPAALQWRQLNLAAGAEEVKRRLNDGLRELLVVKVDSQPGRLEVKHVFARSFLLLEAKEYPALRDYYQKLAANDQQQVVLAGQ